VTAGASAHDGSTDDEITSLLDRVIQRIFAAGLLVHIAADDRSPGDVLVGVLDQLDQVLRDIRTTVASWRRIAAPRQQQRTSDLDPVISHLIAAAEILRQVASAESGSDRSRWMITNDADHTVHRALLLLQEAPGGPTIPRPVSRPTNRHQVRDEDDPRPTSP